MRCVDSVNCDEYSIACDEIAAWLASATSAVAFTGAGISTESGIPDFRSPGGVWAQNRPVYFDEFLASEEARREYWRQKYLTHREFVAARPNDGHLVLAEWEAAGRLRGVLTQNIDGLHQLAGNREVVELHGTARRVACLDCGADFDADPWVERFNAEQIPPACPSCAGRLKHATISFGQQLAPSVLQRAFAWARSSDVFLALGSSLVVEPAASLPRFAAERGARLVIINRDATPLDDLANWTLRVPLGTVLTRIAAGVRALNKANPGPV